LKINRLAPLDLNIKGPFQTERKPGRKVGIETSGKNFDLTEKRSRQNVKSLFINKKFSPIQNFVPPSTNHPHRSTDYVNNNFLNLRRV
jgi:hypothetical protein